jgi:lipoprotein-anchoring transpeptidase ErfK/SrfK
MTRLFLLCASLGILLGSAAPPPPDSPPQPRRRFDPPAQVAIATPAPARPELPLLTAPAPTVVASQEEAAPATPSPVREKKAWKHKRVRVVVSIPQQKAYVFSGEELVATSPVSTGKPGYDTPAGTFRILQKKVKHRSNRYANAPMPYMQRLTSYGIALHAGRLPGYRASHGCIRLPWGFARKLYNLTDYGTTVTVTHKRPRSAKQALRLA